MADYDNTDSGAAFRPFETQSLILQGKVNNSGQDLKIVLVKDQTRDGKNLIEVYEKVGVLFENDKNGNDKAPDYTGPIFEFRRLAAWRRMKDDKPYMSLKISDPQRKEETQQSSTPTLDDDRIPF